MQLENDVAVFVNDEVFVIRDLFNELANFPGWNGRLRQLDKISRDNTIANDDLLSVLFD